jgi:thiamine biosynthesis lipoprotein
MNRRDFLRSPSLARTVGQLVQPFDSLACELPEPVEATLLRFTQRAMATRFEVLLPYGSRSASAMVEAAFREIDRLEQQLTVYRDDSEVSCLNRLAAHRAVPVEEGLFGLLSLARRISESTERAFDITAGALIKAWGFYRGPRRVPSQDQLKQAMSRVGILNMVLHPKSRSVQYLRDGLEINLGSIGKGYALDRVAAILRDDWGLSAGLLHGGHSSVYAIGTQPGEPNGWAVGILHPWNRERRLATVRLKDRALATSAASFQHLEHNGRKLGHILDPRTGWPAEGMASVSVLAPSAAEADALATAFFILGTEEARAYCETHPDIAAVLLEENDSEPIVIGVGGTP